MYYKSTKFNENRWSHFLENKILWVGEEIKKKTARDIYEKTLDIEFERDRSIGLGSTFGDEGTERHTYIHTYTHTHTHRHFF